MVEKLRGSAQAPWRAVLQNRIARGVAASRNGRRIALINTYRGEIAFPATSVFLASPDTSYITGTTLNIDGGATA